MERVRMYMEKHNEYSVENKQVYPRSVLEVEMLELLEDNFREAMISPEYFEKFIDETLEIQILVQLVKSYKMNKEAV